MGWLVDNTGGYVLDHAGIYKAGGNDVGANSSARHFLRE